MFISRRNHREKSMKLLCTILCRVPPLLIEDTVLHPPKHMQKQEEGGVVVIKTKTLTDGNGEDEDDARGS
jgi:hypothetical protein